MVKIKTKVIIMVFIVALILISAAFLFMAKNAPITTEETVSHPNNVIAIIIDLRNMRTAAQVFRNNNQEKLDTIKPELKHLAPYLENPDRFTKTSGEYLFLEANGEWWVGYNLAATDQYVEDRESVNERLLYMGGKTIFASTDINIPYNGEDIIYMPTR